MSRWGTERPWTPEEISIAADLWQRHVTDHYDDDPPRGVLSKVTWLIADTLGRTVASVDNRRQACGVSFSSSRMVSRVSERQLLDRAARAAAADRRTLTQALLGDPPPGYSALDRRRA